MGLFSKQVSWYSLLTAIGIIVYLSRSLLLSNILPLYITVSLWTMLAFYTLFGIAGTLFYCFIDAQAWQAFEYVLDVLSLLVKATIVLALTGGYINMPGQTCF